MFEQTFVGMDGAVRKPWPMLVSAAGQAAIVGSLLLIPLWQTAQLVWKPAVMVYAPPKPVPPPPTVPVAHSTVKATLGLQPVFQAPLTAPRRVPTTINLTGDDFSLPISPSGIIGSISTSAPSFLLNGLETAQPAVAPAAKAADIPKPKPASLKV